MNKKCSPSRNFKSKTLTDTKSLRPTGYNVYMEPLECNIFMFCRVQCVQPIHKSCYFGRKPTLTGAKQLEILWNLALNKQNILQEANL